MRRMRMVQGANAAAALLISLGLALSGMAEARASQWVAAWGSSMQGLAPTTLTNATVQMIARSTIAGDAVRVRLENTFGPAPLTIGEAYVGLRNLGVSLVAGSNRRLTFAGLPSVTIPAGERVMSDPVALAVEAQQDLAVSLYVPGESVPITRHAGALTTSYLTANGAGNHAASEDRSAFTNTTTSMYWLSAIEVFSDSATGAIVAFGDSITDGSCTTLDAHDRWEDLMALRLLLRPGKERAVVNEGIGGNTVTRLNLVPPPDSLPGIERLDRDVVELSGVTHVILFMGTNDIRREASAGQVIAGLQEIIDRVHARGLPIIGVTIIPRHNRPPMGTNTGWNDAKTAIRNAVNAWIRDEADFDAVLDFDKVVRDSNNPDLINPIFNCDGIHPNPFGYFVMGESVDLKILEGRGRPGHRRPPRPSRP
jgi:lysophospholipase L1-like esterase